MNSKVIYKRSPVGFWQKVLVYYNDAGIPCLKLLPITQFETRHGYRRKDAKEWEIL